MAAELLDWGLRASLALAVAIALVLALRAPWRRWLGARSVPWLWLLVPAALLAVSLPGPTVVREVPADALPAVAVLSDAASVTNLSAPPSIAPDVSARPDTRTPLLAAWAAGALALAGVLARQQRRFRRRLGTLRPRADGSWQAEADDIGPVLIGVLVPRIVVPADFEQRYDTQQRALVLAHERCHLRRGDLPVNLLATALRCVFWFHPLVHLAATRLRLDQELACDASVLAHHPRARRAYATALLNTQLADLGLPVGCAWQSSHPLAWRITMLSKPLPGPSRLLLGAGLALLATSATAAALWQHQPPTIVMLPAIATPAATAPLPPLAVQSATPAPAPVAAVAPVAATATVAPVAPVASAGQAAPARAPMRPAPAQRYLDGPEALPLPAPPAPRGELPDAPAPEIAAAETVAADADYVPPRAILAKPARLPKLAGRADAVLIGAVLMRVDIDATGKPVDVVVAENNLGPTYARNAIAAVKRWRFEPARRSGVAEPATVLVPVSFGTRALRADSLTGEAVKHPMPTYLPPPQHVAQPVAQPLPQPGGGR